MSESSFPSDAVKAKVTAEPITVEMSSRLREWLPRESTRIPMRQSGWNRRSVDRQHTFAVGSTIPMWKARKVWNDGKEGQLILYDEDGEMIHFGSKEAVEQQGGITKNH